jgi:hypothetical protein
MDVEVWKQIEDSLNTSKHFWNVRNKPIEILNRVIDLIYTISIYNDEGNRKCMFNHIVLALTFLENPENKKKT